MVDCKEKFPKLPPDVKFLGMFDLIVLVQKCFIIYYHHNILAPDANERVNDKHYSVANNGSVFIFWLFCLKPLQQPPYFFTNYDLSSDLCFPPFRLPTPQLPPRARASRNIRSFCPRSSDLWAVELKVIWRDPWIMIFLEYVVIQRLRSRRWNHQKTLWNILRTS